MSFILFFPCRLIVISPVEELMLFRTAVQNLYMPAQNIKAKIFFLSLSQFTRILFIYLFIYLLIYSFIYLIYLFIFRFIFAKRSKSSTDIMIKKSFNGFVTFITSAFFLIAFMDILAACKIKWRCWAQPWALTKVLINVFPCVSKEFEQSFFS